MILVGIALVGAFDLLLLLGLLVRYRLTGGQ